jgi:hypothetical protein
MPFALVAAVAQLVLLPHGPHGVRGTVALAPVSAHATRVTVIVNVHDKKLRPVHIHGGSCGAFFGLPFGAHLMRGGRTSFVVRVSLQALERNGYALDVHASTTSPSWIACANL